MSLTILDGVPTTDEVVAALTSPVAIGVGGALVGAGLGAAIATSVARKKRKSKVRKSKSRVKRSRKRKYKYAYTARKRKDTSTHRIRQTKNGQPYIILSNGRARFISKSSARASRRRKGGKY